MIYTVGKDSDTLEVFQDLGPKGTQQCVENNGELLCASCFFALAIEKGIVSIGSKCWRCSAPIVLIKEKQ